jgi:hypothetical protein
LEEQQIFRNGKPLRFVFLGCDPLPTGQLEQKKEAEIESDWTVEKHKKMASTAF